MARSTARAHSGMRTATGDAHSTRTATPREEFCVLLLSCGLVLFVFRAFFFIFPLSLRVTRARRGGCKGTRRAARGDEARVLSGSAVLSDMRARYFRIPPGMSVGRSTWARARQVGLAGLGDRVQDSVGVRRRALPVLHTITDTL
eukprot:6176270-Pleurochrysis_carterae.AAC.1